jgi:hypothetical protein
MQNASLVTLEGCSKMYGSVGVELMGGTLYLDKWDANLLRNAYRRGYFTNFELDHLNRKYPAIAKMTEAELMGNPAIIAAVGGAIAGIVGAIGGAIKKKRESDIEEREAQARAAAEAAEREERKRQQQQLALMAAVPIGLIGVMVAMNMAKKRKK